MEMCVSSDFGQQTQVHNCTMIHPQSLKFWECDLHSDHFAERERHLKTVCVWWPWNEEDTAQGTRRRLKRIVMLCPCVCVFVPLCLFVHAVCAYICAGTQRHTFVSIHLYACMRVFVHLCVSVYLYESLPPYVLTYVHAA